MGNGLFMKSLIPDLRPSMQVYVTDAQGLNSFQIAADIEANMVLSLLVSR